MAKIKQRDRERGADLQPLKKVDQLGIGPGIGRGHAHGLERHAADRASYPVRRARSRDASGRCISCPRAAASPRRPAASADACRGSAPGRRRTSICIRRCRNDRSCRRGHVSAFLPSYRPSCRRRGRSHAATGAESCHLAVIVRAASLVGVAGRGACFSALNSFRSLNSWSHLAGTHIASVFMLDHVYPMGVFVNDAQGNQDRPASSGSAASKGRCAASPAWWRRTAIASTS